MKALHGLHSCISSAFEDQTRRFDTLLHDSVGITSAVRSGPYCYLRATRLRTYFNTVDAERNAWLPCMAMSRTYFYMHAQRCCAIYVNKCRSPRARTAPSPPELTLYHGGLPCTPTTHDN